MVLATNKKLGFDAPEATNQTGANKTLHSTPILDQKPSLFPVPTKYELVWQSLKVDGEGIPEETLITEIFRRPSKTEVQEMKKRAHTCGWFLASYSRKPYYPTDDEF